MAFSKTYSETAPADHTKFNAQPGSVRDLKTAIRERLQFGGMYFPSTHDELAGEHTYLRLANTTAPTAVTGKWHLYVDADGLHLVDPSGTEIDLTGDTVQAKTGDWLSSSVATARTGWTNVSATYSNKFMRVNATPLSTSGSDAHTHAAGSLKGPNHTHTVPKDGWGSGATNPDPDGRILTGNGVNDQAEEATGDTTSGSGGTGAVTGTTGSGNNVPAYVTCVLFQKD